MKLIIYFKDMSITKIMQVHDDTPIKLIGKCIYIILIISYLNQSEINIIFKPFNISETVII